MTPLAYLELLRSFASELTLVVAAGVVLFLDLRWKSVIPLSARWARSTAVTVMCLAVAIVARFIWPPVADAPEEMFVRAPVNLWLQTAVLALAGLSLFACPVNGFAEHAGEVCVLFLLATIGLLLVVSTQNLLMLFVALELSSISLYSLTALNQRDSTATEAALKYFLIGGTAAAFTLFGISLLYGLTGTLRFAQMAAGVGEVANDPLFLTALIMTVAGVGFKIAVVPFHTWAPDVYQTAPGPVAALVASGSKLAGFFALYRLLEVGLASAAGGAGWFDFRAGWLPLLAVLALASMVVGNLAALAQTNLRRLIAWSAIAQAGYALVGLMGPGDDAVRALAYFAFTYGLSVIGLFGVLGILETAGEPSNFEALRGLWQRSPLLTLCLSAFILSLAGLPPFAGFFGKLFLFVAAAKRGNLELLWLVIAALGLSVVSLYYYLQVLKPALIPTASDSARPLEVSWASGCGLAITALALLVLGCAPSWLFAGLGW